MKDSEYERLRENFIESMTVAVQAALAFDDVVPDEITDLDALLDYIPPCPACHHKITISETKVELSPLLQELNAEICRQCIPDRWHAVLHGMHAHLERCQK